MKRILSLWLPVWPVERLRRHVPEAVPDDQPFALVESGARGIRISAVNAIAAREGVRIGTVLADARAALPRLLSRPAEPARDRASLNNLARWTGRYGPARGVDGVDGIWVDVTGVAHLFGGEAALLADVKRRLAGFGLTVEAAIAGTFGAAHAGARFARHLRGETPCGIVPADGERAALAALPVAGLRLEPDTVQLLQRLGLRHIGQLYDIPRAALERRFHAESGSGRKISTAREREGARLAGAVLARLDQALGLREEPRVPLGEPAALSVRRTWGEPLISAEALEHELAVLVEDLCARLGEAGLGCRRLRLALFRADGSMAEVAAGFSSASRDADHMLRLLGEKLGAIDAGFGIDVMALDVLTAEALAGAQAALGTTRDVGPGVAALTDRLANRLGVQRITCFMARASYVPERSERRVSAAASGASTGATSGATSGAAWPMEAEARSGPLRPPVLLSSPERISVMAEVPEGPPRQFTWRRVVHRIVKAQGPERIEPEWWRSLPGTGDAPAVPAPRARDYYALEDQTGARFWVFRDGLYQRAAEEGLPLWFVQGLF